MPTHKIILLTIYNIYILSVYSPFSDKVVIANTIE